MLKFLHFILEQSKEVHHVTAFMRTQPPTNGHEEVINRVKSEAKKQGADHSVVLSHSHDAKNPLTPEQKLKHAKRGFPNTNITTSSNEHPTLLHHLSNLHKKGVTHVTIVTGQDRAEELKNLAQKYNGVKGKTHGHYDFKKINVVSAGDRDPDVEGVKGISGTKMRAAAVSGDRETFHAGAPTAMSPEHKDEMMKDVANGMKKK